MSEEEAYIYNYADLNYMEYEDVDIAQPSTSNGNAQSMVAIKTTQNPYYCGDDVQLVEDASGNRKAFLILFPEYWP